ncbi:uncharacterized protein DS421_5g146970 [Arachis hypogaea]|nr:uncharacterized protein DS421_5g146970 [Arachis hypogaea]
MTFLLLSPKKKRKKKPIVKPSLSLRPFVSKLRPLGVGTPAMDVLTDVVDNDEGVVDVTNLLCSKSNTKTTPSNRKREQVRAENNKNNLNIYLTSVNSNKSTGNIGSNLRKQTSPQSVCIATWDFGSIFD